MTRVRTIARALLAVACLAVSCTKAEAGLEFSKESLEMDFTGGDTSFEVTSESGITAESDASWCIAGLGTRVAGMSTVTLRVYFNTDSQDRTARITVTCGEQKKTLTLTQGGLSIDKATVDAVTPAQLAAEMGMGWNLGNQMDSYANGVASETVWGNGKATQATFDALAAAGFKTVRIPVTWLGQFKDDGHYTINTSWLNRVAQIAGYAKNAGLTAIVNMHHEDTRDQKADGTQLSWLDILAASKSEEKNAEIKNQLAQMWYQIATKFKDEGDWLIFEAVNEIQDGGWGWGENLKDGGKQYKCLNEWMQTFVKAVRAAGGENAKRWLAVTGYSTNHDLTMANLTFPTDYTSANRLLVDIHFYDPYDYTLGATYSEWGHTGTDKANWGDEDNVTTVFAKLKSKFVDKGYPVYLGETGCSFRATQRAKDFHLYYLEYVYKAAREAGLIPILWDNGATGTGMESGGYLNHATGAYIERDSDQGAYSKAAVQAMYKGTYTEDPSYTLETVYNSAPYAE